MRHAAFVALGGAVAAAVGAAASGRQEARPAPPMAQAALVRAMIRDGVVLVAGHPLCVALAPPGPPPERLAMHLIPPLDSLRSLSPRAQADLRKAGGRAHPWSDCEVEMGAEPDGSPTPSTARVRATGREAWLVWLRDAALASDSAARGQVAQWSGTTVAVYSCEAVRRRGVWAPGHCVLLVVS